MPCNLLLRLLHQWCLLVTEMAKSYWCFCWDVQIFFQLKMIKRSLATPLLWRMPMYRMLTSACNQTRTPSELLRNAFRGNKTFRKQCWISLDSWSIFCLRDIHENMRTKPNDPVHEISNNVVCATSKASDQPAHTRSLIRAFARRLSILLLLTYWLNTIWSFLVKRRLQRLVWVYTCQNVKLLEISCRGSNYFWYIDASIMFSASILIGWLSHVI